MEQVSRRLPPDMALWSTSRTTSSQADPARLICRSREAASRGDPALCRRDLKRHADRQRCERFVAIFTARPSLCPTRGWPRYREGLCLALATRTPSLCQAAPASLKGLCLAMLLGPRHCKALTSTARLRCRRAVTAWKGVITTKKSGSKSPAKLKPRLELRATALTQGLSLPAGSSSAASRALDTGILLADKHGTGDWLIIDRRFAPQERYTPHRHRSRLRIELRVPLPAAGTGRIRLGQRGEATAHLRNSSFVRTQIFEATSGVVEITDLDRKQAGRVAGTFDLELTDGVDRIKLTGKLETFIRELVPLSDVASYVRSYTGSGARTRRVRPYGSIPPAKVASLAARIRRVRDDLYDVDPNLRNSVAKDTTMITRAASISRLTGGSRSGYRLYQVYRNNLLWLLGLRDKDVVIEINGRPLDCQEDLFEAFVRFKRARRLVLTIERGTKKKQITYRIRPVRRPRKTAP